MTREKTACKCPATMNGRCRMHGGKSTGAPTGNSSALKHGRYTTQAIDERKEVADLIRAMRDLVDQAGG
ncbi:HGGxSTG domain-containing protein [Psychromarinibacter sediminicola]|uniref:HGGxSTG domain-containing protein n=1 Tax=Psychromarinibacter sediminicola TaxID=3033385 RepID=UPI0035AC2812